MDTTWLSIPPCPKHNTVFHTNLGFPPGVPLLIHISPGLLRLPKAVPGGVPTHTLTRGTQQEPGSPQRQSMAPIHTNTACGAHSSRGPHNVGLPQAHSSNIPSPGRPGADPRYTHSFPRSRCCPIKGPHGQQHGAGRSISSTGCTDPRLAW